MGYSQLRVLIGGLFHVPVLIGLFWLADNLFSKGYQEQKAKEAKAEARAKAKALALEKAKKEAEQKLKAELDSNTVGSSEGIEKGGEESAPKDQPPL